MNIATRHHTSESFQSHSILPTSTCLILGMEAEEAPTPMETEENQLPQAEEAPTDMDL